MPTADLIQGPLRVPHRVEARLVPTPDPIAQSPHGGRPVAQPPTRDAGKRDEPQVRALRSSGRLDAASPSSGQQEHYQTGVGRSRLRDDQARSLRRILVVRDGHVDLRARR